jgi:hypothetical protein
MEKRKERKSQLTQPHHTDILPVYVDCVIKINGKRKAHKITILINTTASH